MRKAAFALPMLLAACAYQGRPDALRLEALAADPDQPALALLEHVLTGHFVETGGNGPTTCAALAPTPLTLVQEQALIERLVRLAPASRCIARGSGMVDAITGAPAQQVQVYEFACAGPALCTGWAVRPGTPAIRYALRFETGAWRFDADPRRLAE